VSEANVETLERILQQLFESRRVDPALLAEEVEWGRPTRMEWFNTHREAMEAGGVRE
jgi:hypothetical protein